MPTIQFDLTAIEASLREVQRDFVGINATLETPRDPLRDEVVENMLAGYRYVKRLLDADIDPFAMGNSHHLLWLNRLVLCGTGAEVHREWAHHIEETERRFYDDRSPGGVRALMNYLADHREAGVCQRAAGVFVQMLTAPQLFIEGNHRTGVLVMNAILGREGRGPFVLSSQNAKAFFDPSSLIKSCRKHSPASLLQVPRLRQRVVALIERGIDRRSGERRRIDRRTPDQ